MKYAEDFRTIARHALKGKWLTAVLAGFIAALIGAEVFGGGGGSSNQDSDLSWNDLEVIFGSERWQQIRTFIFAGIVLLVIWLLITLIIGGAGRLGYATFNLKLVDGKPVAVSDLFSQFHRLWQGFCMNFLMGLYTLLWTLLFLIPGIIKEYSYAMTPYILAEHPEMTVNEAITESRRIMDGNKWRLFCLGFSFIGWALLCALPTVMGVYWLAAVFYDEPWRMLVGIIPVCIPAWVGGLFLRPYQEAAYAAFYRDVSGTETYPAQIWTQEERI